MYHKAGPGPRKPKKKEKGTKNEGRRGTRKEVEGGKIIRAVLAEKGSPVNSSVVALNLQMFFIYLPPPQ